MHSRKSSLKEGKELNLHCVPETVPTLRKSVKMRNWIQTKGGLYTYMIAKNCMLMPCKFAWNVTIKTHAFYNQLEDGRKIWLLRFPSAVCGLVYMAPVCKLEKKKGLFPRLQSSAQGLARTAEVGLLPSLAPLPGVHVHGHRGVCCDSTNHISALPAAPC